MVKHATQKMGETLLKLSQLSPQEIAPDQYLEYTPSFQSEVEKGTARSSASNVSTRWVGKGKFSTKNLLDPEKMVQLDSEDDDIKEMVVDALDGDPERD